MTANALAAQWLLSRLRKTAALSTAFAQMQLGSTVTKVMQPAHLVFMSLTLESQLWLHSLCLWH